MKKKLTGLLLCLCAAVALLTTAALADGDTHSNHCVCGKTHADVGNHTTESQITNWTAWGETGSLPNSSGNYYLTNDVTLTSKWEPATGTVLCLNGHTITGNPGSPVIGVKSGVTFTLTDCATTSGKITHESGKAGYGVNVEDGTFNMYAGEISGNSGGYCGGVYVHNNQTTGTFNMYGGSITDNSATDSTSSGGGVKTDETNTFNMYGGSISGNTAYRGGGVYVKGHFNMSGGEITGNSVSYTGTNTDMKACGGGVYVDGYFKVSGAAQITGNTASGATNNVELNKYQLINVTDTLDSAASIGVTTPTTPTDGSPQPFAQADSAGSYTLKSADKNAFTPDLGTDNYHIKLDGGQLKLYAGAALTHTHVWDYRGNGTSAIDAYCKDSNCDVSGTVTITAPTGTLTYDGTEKKATLTNNLPTGVTAPTISYQVWDRGTWVDLPTGTTVPTNAGKYEASITLGNMRTSVAYTINKATPTASDITVLPAGPITYSGSPYVVSASGKTGMGEITVKYFDNEGTQLPSAPTNAGTYTFKIDVAEGTNYTAVSDLSQTGWGFTISTKSVDDLDVSVGSLTYTSGNQSPTVTVKDGDRTLTADTDYSLTITPQINAGTYSLTVTGTTNYSGTREGITWSIAPKPVTISGVTAADKEYDGNNSATVSTTGVNFGGIVDGDSLTISATGIFEDTNAGTDKTVNLTLGDLGGSSAANYTKATTGNQTTTTATITPKPITPSIDVDGTYTYTGNPITPTYTVKDDTTDLATSDYTAQIVNNTNAGTATIKLTAKATGNYTWDGEATQTFTIGQATYGNQTASGSAKYGSSGEVDLSGYIVEGGTASYDAVNSSDTYSILNGTPSVENGKLYFAFVNDETKANKTATIKVNVASANYENYTITVTVTVLAKTAQAALTIHASKTTVTYGETVTLSTSGGSGDGEVTYTVTNGAVSLVGDQLTLKQVGDITVMASKAEDDDYAAINSDPITITVNKATVTVTALDRSIYVNGTAPDLTNPVKGTDYTVTGLVDGDTLTGPIAMKYQQGGLDATPNVATANTYTIVISGATADSDKYNAVVFENGTLTISNRSYSGGSSKPTVTVPVSSAAGSVQVKAEVNKGTATVNVSDKQLEQVIASGSGNVTVDVSGVKNVDSVKLPANVVEKTGAAENTALTVALPAGSVTLDETALGSVAAGKDVTVSVKEVPATDLTEQQQKAVGDMASIGLVVDVDVFVGGTKQSSFNGGKLTISIPYTPKSGEDTSKLTVWFIKDDGTIENKGGYYDAENKCFVFETDHLSRYVLMYDNRPVSFADVSADAWYAAAVNWAVGKDITGGIGDGKFGPDLSCTRAQLVTFLYRAAVAQGMDTSVGEDTNILSYTDAFSIPEYAVSAFQWAIGAGIVQGYDGALMPNDDCTRGQIVTMLYRFAVAADKDVSVGEDTNILSYADAFEVPEYAVAPFQWATGAGVIQGADGKLMPSDTCTRGQIVTMLYRLLGE